MSVDIGLMDVDAISLLQLGQREGLSGAALAEAQALLNRTSGTFLPMWEELEGLTGGRSATSDLIQRVRNRLVGARVDLLKAVGRARLEDGDAVGAVTVLKEALELRGNREDVGKMLVDAYRASGQDLRAAELERTYQPG